MHQSGVQQLLLFATTSTLPSGELGLASEDEVDAEIALVGLCFHCNGTSPRSTRGAHGNSECIILHASACCLAISSGGVATIAHYCSVPMLRGGGLVV